MDALDEAGLVQQQQRQRPLPALVFIHPVIASFARLEQLEPARKRYERRRSRKATPPPEVIIRPGHIVHELHLLLLPRSRRPMPMPAAYLAEFLTHEETLRCMLAAERNRPIAELPDVDAAFRSLFDRRRQREVTRSVMRIWIAQIMAADDADTIADEAA